MFWCLPLWWVSQSVLSEFFSIFRVTAVFFYVRSAFFLSFFVPYKMYIIYIYKVLAFCDINLQPFRMAQIKSTSLCLKDHSNYALNVSDIST